MIDFVNNSEPDLTAENLNKMQQDIGTVVSPTEPQGNERLKVWMQKGKNLFDGNYKSGYGYDNSTGNVITLSTVYSNQSIITVPYGATKLILSKNGEGKNTRFFFYDKNKTFLSSIVNNDGAVTIPENARYFNFQVGMNTVNNDFTKIQVETENLTSYEAYIEPKIYVLNNNDVYEEFIKNEEDTGWKDVEMYSGYTSNESLPMQYRIKNNVLFLQGVIQVSGNFPSSNTNVFKVPGIVLSRTNLLLCEISGTPFNITQARRSRKCLYKYIWNSIFSKCKKHSNINILCKNKRSNSTKLK